jgi:hypothetical protein
MRLLNNIRTTYVNKRGATIMHDNYNLCTTSIYLIDVAMVTELAHNFTLYAIINNFVYPSLIFLLFFY